jgi:hypothetical protein
MPGVVPGARVVLLGGGGRGRVGPRRLGEGFLHPGRPVEVGEAVEVEGEGEQAELGSRLVAAAQQESAARPLEPKNGQPAF